MRIDKLPSGRYSYSVGSDEDDDKELAAFYRRAVQNMTGVTDEERAEYLARAQELDPLP